MNNSSSSPSTPTNKRPILFIEDEQTYPSLCCAVYIAGPPEDTYGFSGWLGRAGCYRVDEPEDADIVFFTGGPDVDPQLYGEAAMPCTEIDADRDKADMDLYTLCESLGIPMVGICRGMQFLWAMQGGKLFQDLDGHYSGDHEIRYTPTGQIFKASSVHHQAIRPASITAKVKFLATACESTQKRAVNVSDKSLIDMEMYVFEDKAIVGIQGHPEYTGFPNFSRLCLEVIDQYIFENSATKVIGGKLRLESAVPVQATEPTETTVIQGE